MKTFVLSEGRRYQDLQPASDLLSPNRSGAWVDAKTLLANGSGKGKLPPFPSSSENSTADWALKITLIESQ